MEPSKSVRVWGGRKRKSNRSPLDDYDDDKEEEQKCIYFDFSITFVTTNDLSFSFSSLLHFFRRPQCSNVLISAPIEGRKAALVLFTKLLPHLVDPTPVVTC
jgi:hypothetical protein